MTVVLGNGATLLVLVTYMYLDTNTELAHSELHWPGTNFPPGGGQERRTGGTRQDQVNQVIRAKSWHAGKRGHRNL